MTVSATGVGLRERHKRQRRERILEAIRQLLRECPGELPTVERIAALADISPATVFNLVGPRDEQWAALGDALLRELDASLAVAGDEGPREQAHRIVAETAGLFIADEAVSKQLINSWGRSGELLKESPIPQLRAAFRRGQAAGLLRPDLHIEALVGHVATACGGALRQWAGGQISDAAFRTRARFAVDVAFAAGASKDSAVELQAPLQRTRRVGSR